MRPDRAPLPAEHPRPLPAPGRPTRHDLSNILVVRLSSIGDIVFALPALEVLRAYFPDARITWAAEDRAAGILEGHPLIDELIVIPRRAWRRMRAEPGGTLRTLGAMRRMKRELRSRQFDVSIDFQGNLKSGLVTWAAGAPLRLGLGGDETKEPNWLFTNRRLRLDGEVMHRIERDLRLLTLLDLPYEFRWPSFSYAEEDRHALDEFFAGLRRPVVTLVPGTSAWGPHKRWPLESYAALGDALIERRDATVLVAWGPGEEELVGGIRGLMEHDALPAPPTLNMRQVGYLMRSSDLVVGSDTGPTHLAAAQRVDTITLFGPYDPRLYYPYQHAERAHFARVPCAPCRHRGCTTRDCMERIAVEAVFESCTAALDGLPARSRDLTPRKTVRV